MKKTALIVGGIIFIAVLLAAWLYLLFFGTPEQMEDVFSDLSFGRNGGEAVAPDPTDDTDDTPPPPINSEIASTNQLRQITTDPVAGFQILATPQGTSSPQIMYVEAGTGHIYRYDTDSGDRERISNRTIPQTNHALITSQGRYVVTEAEGTTRIFSTHGTNTEVLLNTQDPLRNLAVVNDRYLLYTLEQNQAVTGIALDMSNNTTQTLFTFPATAIQVSWGQSISAPHIVYTLPTDTVRSHAYVVDQNSRQRLPITGYGLNLFHTQDQVFYSRNNDPARPGERSGFVHDLTTNTTSRLPLPVLREKCTIDRPQDSLWCGHDFDQSYSLSNWYKGVTQLNDSFWRIDASRSSATFVRNIQETAGRAVDISSITHMTDTFVFTNKINRTLWLYEHN